MAADVYSFGVLCWEMCTGKLAASAFAGRPMPMAIKQQLEHGLPPLPGTCHEGFRGLVLECLERDPQRRPTFGAVHARLVAVAAEVEAAWGRQVEEEEREEEARRARQAQQRREREQQQQQHQQQAARGAGA